MEPNRHFQNFDSVRRVATNCDSNWNDNSWIFQGRIPGSQTPRCVITWDFELEEGKSFVFPEFSNWLWEAKTIVWLILNRPVGGPREFRAATLVGYWVKLRILIRWMYTEGYRSFRSLQPSVCDRFILFIVSRKNKQKDAPVKSSTIASFQRLLVMIYRYGKEVPDFSIPDPLRGKKPVDVRLDSGKIPVTPDVVAIFFVAKAIGLLDGPANDVIAVCELVSKSLGTNTPLWKRRKVITEACRSFPFCALPGENAPWFREEICSGLAVRFLMDRIIDACFIVISYLVGPRVSEILGLEKGCVEPALYDEERTKVRYIVGRVYKTAKTETGKFHKWVAPEPAVRAIRVLERLSEFKGALTDSKSLWLCWNGPGFCNLDSPVGILSTRDINRRLNSFASFIEVPLHEGERWIFSSHQGRKTFARFIGRRDRSGLQSLREHLDHVSIAMTDAFYVGTDFELRDLVDQEAMEETAAVLARMLTATELGGKAGQEILGLSRSLGFQGRGIDDSDVTAWISDYLRDVSVLLVVCEYGYCVYQKETSACMGSELGPDLVRRNPLVCAGCSNFGADETNLGFWVDLLDRNREVLDHSGTSEFTLKHAVEVDKVARRMVSGIRGEVGGPDAN